MNKQSESHQQKKRPALVTALCIIGFIGAVLSIIFNLGLLTGFGLNLISAIGIRFPIWAISSSILISVLAIGCLLLIWNMEKKGLYYLIAVLSLSVIVTAVIGANIIFPLIIYSVFIALFFNELKNMK